jgi:Protein of unknown function (DUF2516)
MSVVGELYTWTDRLLFYAIVLLRIWAVVDCLTRKAAAFKAAERLTKPAWLAILVLAGLLGTFLGRADSAHSEIQVFSLISIVAAAVYLADVRPAVREISGG